MSEMAERDLEWVKTVNKALLESTDRLGTRLRKIHETAEQAKGHHTAGMAVALADIANLAVADDGPYGRMEKMEEVLRAIVNMLGDRGRPIVSNPWAVIQHINQIARQAFEPDEGDMTERDLAESAAVLIKVGTELISMFQQGRQDGVDTDGTITIRVGAESLREAGAHLKKIGIDLLQAIPEREMEFKEASGGPPS